MYKWQEEKRLESFVNYLENLQIALRDMCEEVVEGGVFYFNFLGYDNLSLETLKVLEFEFKDSEDLFKQLDEYSELESEEHKRDFLYGEPFGVFGCNEWGGIDASDLLFYEDFKDFPSCNFIHLRPTQAGKYLLRNGFVTVDANIINMSLDSDLMCHFDDGSKPIHVDDIAKGFAFKRVIEKES